jgi:hypothetical protein
MCIVVSTTCKIVDCNKGLKYRDCASYCTAWYGLHCGTASKQVLFMKENSTNFMTVEGVQVFVHMLKYIGGVH